MRLAYLTCAFILATGARAHTPQVTTPLGDAA